MCGRCRLSESPTRTRGAWLYSVTTVAAATRRDKVACLEHAAVGFQRNLDSTRQHLQNENSHRQARDTGTLFEEWLVFGRNIRSAAQQIITKRCGTFRRSVCRAARRRPVGHTLARPAGTRYRRSALRLRRRGRPARTPQATYSTAPAPRRSSRAHRSRYATRRSLRTRQHGSL